MNEHHTRLAFGLIVVTAMVGGVAMFYSTRRPIGPDYETWIEILEGINERCLAIGLPAPYTNVLPIAVSRMTDYSITVPVYIEMLCLYYCDANGQTYKRFPLHIDMYENRMFEEAGIGIGGRTNAWPMAVVATQEDTENPEDGWFTRDGVLWVYPNMLEEVLGRPWGPHMISPWTGMLWQAYQALAFLSNVSLSAYSVSNTLVGAQRKHLHLRGPDGIPVRHAEYTTNWYSPPPEWWYNLNILPDFSNLLVWTTPWIDGGASAPLQQASENIEQWNIMGINRATMSNWVDGYERYWWAAEVTNKNDWTWDRVSGTNHITIVGTPTGFVMRLRVQRHAEITRYNWRGDSIDPSTDSFRTNDTIDMCVTTMAPTVVALPLPSWSYSWELFEWRTNSYRGRWGPYPTWAAPQGQQGTYRLWYTLPTYVSFDFKRCRPREQPPQ